MISFIIPTLREASVIEKTLLWISQYNGEKEIIISDGGSDDGTIEIARKYTDKIIVYKGEKRQTIGMGRNL
ncbi:MAG: glycosyltransferase [bacterium]